jgi:hypothetical protein
VLGTKMRKLVPDEDIAQYKVATSRAIPKRDEIYYRATFRPDTKM